MAADYQFWGFIPLSGGMERAMGLEPTISCLGSMRSTTELRPRGVENYTRILLRLPIQQVICQFK